jgi:chemotaxis protein methyltransferase CheR
LTDAPAFRHLQQLMYREAGVVIEDDKRYLVETRLLRLLAEQNIASIGELSSRLRASPDVTLSRRVIESILNGETFFFRDPPMFEGLRKTIVPQLLDRRRDERRLVIWSLACSTGQEPYSVAMLLADSFPELADWDVRIVACDYSRSSIERGRRGVYGQLDVNRGLPAQMLVRHFEDRDDGWSVMAPLRRRVEFRVANLLEWWPPEAEADVVLMRNVMIYWDRETKRSVLARVRRLLRPDGVVILGAAETTLFIDDAFEPLSCDGVTWYRTRAPAQRRSTPILETLGIDGQSPEVGNERA